MEVFGLKPEQAAIVENWIKKRMDMKKDQPRRRKVWAVVSMCSWILSYFSCQSILRQLAQYSILIPMCLFVLFASVYFALLNFLYSARDPTPYVLRGTHKQLYELAFVVFSACWTYYERDGHISTAILGPVLCLNVIPILNLWWYFENFGFWDCCLLILIDAALFCCRNYGAVILMVLAVTGITLQLSKNVYCRYSSQKIKNGTEKHLV